MRPRPAMLLFRFLALTLLATLASARAHALGQPRFVTNSPDRGALALAAGGKAIPIKVDSTDFPGVIRAAHDLQADIQRVTGISPQFVGDQNNLAKLSGEVVLIGTVGKSATIDRLVREHKIDVHQIAGKWESTLVQVVEKPLPGVARALVIAGSDKRGTIFGIYDLSEQIGVSPWYWWADVPVTHRDALYILPGSYVQGEPAVKYRGIFLNDEAPALSGWTHDTFGGMNHQFYTKVFELLLRLRANYLWPAMWGNAFNADDTLNPVLADQYGIVMGTSHHEPMLRAQQEWKRYGTGPWDYNKNANTLDSFWTTGIRHMDHHESIVTVGMRGDGDMPMEEGSNIKLLEKIVADQRAILQKVTGKPASATPQSWALYKEVQDYYDKGMRVPDDITLLLCDDNWGNVRKLPLLDEKPRAGGYGLYYHFDYVGGPRN